MDLDAESVMNSSPRELFSQKPLEGLSFREYYLNDSIYAKQMWANVSIFLSKILPACQCMKIVNRRTGKLSYKDIFNNTASSLRPQAVVNIYSAPSEMYLALPLV